MNDILWVPFNYDIQKENWDEILDLNLENIIVEMLVGIKNYELEYKFEGNFKSRLNTQKCECC